MALKAIQEEADDFLTKHLIHVARELDEISLEGVVHYLSSTTDHSRSLIGVLKIAGTKLPLEFIQSQTLEWIQKRQISLLEMFALNCMEVVSQFETKTIDQIFHGMMLAPVPRFSKVLDKLLDHNRQVLISPQALDDSVEFAVSHEKGSLLKTLISNPVVVSKISLETITTLVLHLIRTEGESQITSLILSRLKTEDFIQLNHLLDQSGHQELKARLEGLKARLAHSTSVNVNHKMALHIPAIHH